MNTHDINDWADEPTDPNWPAIPVVDLDGDLPDMTAHITADGDLVVMDRVDAWEALFRIEDAIEQLHAERKGLLDFLRATPASVIARPAPEPVEPVTPSVSRVPHRLLAERKAKARGEAVSVLTLGIAKMEATGKAVVHNGTSRHDDAEKLDSFDFLAHEAIVGSDLKLELAQAINRTVVHGWDVKQPNGSTERRWWHNEQRADGEEFRRTVSEQSQVIGDMHYLDDFDRAMAAVEVDGRYFLVDATKRTLDGSIESHRNLYARICWGKTLPKGSPERPSKRFIWEPQRYVEVTGEPIEDIARMAGWWKTEVTVTNDMFDHHVDLDTVGHMI